ncbi:signal peptidase-like protein [Vairimorpha apis BRL 01]|uniref:Signal peptidase-like protein n=1 Tax=Vairimorpha apis BRL 01 TaxID=1037528 RepID=T0L1F1_9MICR|nr:signal peptidase-like protein [Vairimorpha apis BRL 01]
MKYNDNWSSPFLNSLWSDTTETFIESEEDWRIVGTNPFKRRSKSIPDAVVSDIYKPSEFFYIIEFSSKRLDLAYMDNKIMYKPKSYVIIEADRGEDCGLIVDITTKTNFDKLLRKHENIINEIKPKNIYRLAKKEDLQILGEKKTLELNALALCKEKIKDYGLKMIVVDCEYQWDLKKIIFYYNSDDRIDFKELVRELYKIYKLRIWMCSLEKSKNRYLRELIST